ncbi:MAG: ribbon-helix-helix domain-containing protein [Chloroflexota bacterium]|nr:ribbon-helix-helix domain-containing protein [Chloroflexota bacterium]MDP9378588.1 ribbon-helix-helix domain-containing protein [Chloroflexota bacterium]
MTHTSRQHPLERHRTTIYLEEEDILGLDEIRMHIRRTERRKVDRSELIREAIRTTIREYREGRRGG